jgi:ATP-binding cassette, subfamily B, bacterial PglK
MHNIFEFLKKVIFILGKDKRKFYLFIPIFLFLSLFDLIGLSLIVPIVLMLSEDSGGLVNNFNEKFFSKIGFILDYEQVLIFLSLSLILIFLFKAFLSIIINKKILEFSWGKRTDLRSFLMKCYQNLPYREYIKKNTAEFIQTMEGPVGDYCSGVLTNLLRVIGEVTIMVVILIFLGNTNLYALLFIIFLYGFLFLIYNRFFIYKVVTYGKNAIKGSIQMFQAVTEGVSGLKEIRILGREGFFHNAVVDGASYQAKNVIKSQIITLSPKYLIELMLVISTVTISSMLYLTGSSINSLLATISVFGFAAVRLTPSINIITTGLTTIRYSTYATEKIYNDIKDYKDIQHASVQTSNQYSVSNDFSFEKIIFNNVSFSYQIKGPPTLNKINLSIYRNDSIGIIGGSGSGKTTLVDLILGLLEPSSGQIFLNEKPMLDRIDVWRSKVAYLPQEIFLIDNSLLKNISLELNEKNIDYQKLRRAIKTAKLDDFVNDLPNGINTEIGQNGIMISGGQRQRIALARAFYHDREILVLDEATSALDNQIEQEIVKEINLLKNKKTMIVIAHRLTTLKHCDKIYRLDQGKIVETGSYEEIIGLNI